MKQRLRELYPNKINNKGEFQITSSVHRTQEGNIADAMEKLEKIIEVSFQFGSNVNMKESKIVPKVRKIKLERTEKGEHLRLKEKKLHSDKKSRRQRRDED
jgi:hypothetical protein